MGRNLLLTICLIIGRSGVRKLDHEGNPLDGAGFDIRKIGILPSRCNRAYTGNPVRTRRIETFV